MRKIFAGVSTSALALFLVVACGSSSESSFGTDDKDGSAFENDGSFGNTTKPDGGDPYANDPPLKWCGPTGQPEPPKPGGTEACPDDKNKPGCACKNLGEKAACWTGLRANRGLGVCKDGSTTCQQISENTRAWGPCEGEVLPTAGVTKGAGACKCFSAGKWDIANLVPCFISNVGMETTPYAYSSTTVSPTQTSCSGNSVPPTKPAGTWSTDSLTVDCAGHFKLCYALKAGTFETPSSSDCKLSEVCTEADYIQENVKQDFPPLDSWTSNDTTCANKFLTIGGYGEMTVKGLSVRCDEVDDGAGNAFVFNRVKYCPSKCSNGMNPTDPDCQNCGQGGSGQF